MQIESPKLGLFTRLKLAWFRFMRWVLHLWVKAKILPQPFDDLVIDRDKPICFVIDSLKNAIVNIKLSLDGGFTYPITLLEDTDNDGSAFVTVPDAVTTQARVRIEAADNIFFDISNQNFPIEAATERVCMISLS